jgi:hypothetical protein
LCGVEEKKNSSVACFEQNVCNSSKEHKALNKMEDKNLKKYYTKQQGGGGPGRETLISCILD